MRSGFSASNATSAPASGGGGGAAPTRFLATAGGGGNDSNSGTDVSHPWLTFAHAWANVSAGDVVSVLDGAFTSASPPAGKSGSAGNPIVFQAANDGGATITDGLAFTGNAYLTLIGFGVSKSGATFTGASNGAGNTSHHNTIQRCGFHCTNLSLDDANFYWADGSHDNLVEDCWFWGGGRYTYLIYGGGVGQGDGNGAGGAPNLDCSNNTTRRCVMRMDQSADPNGNPAAAIAVYYASNNLFENCIAIDGVMNGASSNAAFYCTGHFHPPTSSANRWLGCLALKMTHEGFYLDTPAATADNGTIQHCVLWDTGGIALGFNGDNSAGSTATGWTVDHCTVGAGAGGGTIHSGNTGTTYRNTLHINNTGFGILNGGGGTITTSDHNGYFNNSSGPRSGVSAGTGDLTSDPGLLYIGRIEVASAYHNAGSSGDIGASITKRYQDGTLTGTDLWPWPNEARIKSDMAASSTRGFAGDSSLTHYVWNYLGNGSPY